MPRLNFRKCSVADMARKYTQEQIAYLREIAPGRYLYQIVQMMNERFSTALSESQIKCLMVRNGIKNGMQLRCPPEKVRRLTTPEQDTWIKAHSAGKTSAELIAMIKEKFGIVFTVEQIKGYKNRKHINTGLTGRYEKGHIPFNKGRKMPAEVYAKAAPTMFKKGQLPALTRPIGTERWHDDGYLWVKVAHPNKWRQKHRVIWEAANGPIMPGYKIIFADGNRSNFDINNLICVSAAELVRLNQKGLIFNNPEATKAGVLVARLLTKAGKIKRGE